jgi:guanylate kinase
MIPLPIDREILDQSHRSVLLVLTGPTAAGKDSLIAQLVKHDPSLVKITTTTSREKREGESEGHPYHFKSRDEFEKLIAEGAFFEWVEFRGELYGTQKKTLMDTLAQGVTVIWKIETKGVKNVQDKIRLMVPRVVFVYLAGESVEEMRQRVMESEGEAGAKVRWNESLVIWELKQFTDCDYLVINKHGKLSDAVSDIEALLRAKRLQIIHPSQ